MVTNPSISKKALRTKTNQGTLKDSSSHRSLGT